MPNTVINPIKISQHEYDAATYVINIYTSDLYLMNDTAGICLYLGVDHKCLERVVKENTTLSLSPVTGIEEYAISALEIPAKYYHDKMDLAALENGYIEWI